MTFVEFDDQGWFWDRKQMEVLMRLLFNGRDGKGNPSDPIEHFLIVVFAHGWNHTANACDNNVVCFQRRLERLDILERETARKSGYPPRKVIGVFVGWRGLTTTVELFEPLTFWDRKKAAERVGFGGVTELLVRLKDFRRFKNPQDLRHKTLLIIAGHSFGAKVIYSAISHSLIELAARMREKDGKYQYEVARSFGDLIVLVNPAIEGSLFEPLHHVATNRCYPDSQQPVMLVMTSKADSATRKMFPIGQALDNVFENWRSTEQEETVNRTVGHLDRYRTHKLELTGKVEPPKVIEESDPCGCPYVRSTEEFYRDFIRGEGEEAAFLRNGHRIREKFKRVGELGQYSPDPQLKRKEIEYGRRLKMTRNLDYSANYPYLVIETDEKLIPGHNEIHGEDFTNFLRRFFVQHIMWGITFPKDQCSKMPACKPTDVEPCERSCSRLDENGRRGTNSPACDDRNVLG